MGLVEVQDAGKRIAGIEVVADHAVASVSVRRGKLRRGCVCAISEEPGGPRSLGDGVLALKLHTGSVRLSRVSAPSPEFSRAILLVLIKAIFAVIHAVLQAVASTLLAMSSVAVLAVLVIGALGFAIALGVSSFAEHAWCGNVASATAKTAIESSKHCGRLLTEAAPV